MKLEVIGDEQTLFPDTEELMSATKTLVKEGFIVLPYTNDDLIVARKLIDAGASAVMPLGAPIGSGMGIQNLANLRILRERITEVPLIVDAGVGTASDAAIAMELGADGVLMNTAIAGAQDAVLMAEAMRAAVEAGRKAFLAGRIEKKLYATASSPLAGVVCRSTSSPGLGCLLTLFLHERCPPRTRCAPSSLRSLRDMVKPTHPVGRERQLASSVNGTKCARKYPRARGRACREAANRSSSTRGRKIIPRSSPAARTSSWDTARGRCARARKSPKRRPVPPTDS